MTTLELAQELLEDIKDNGVRDVLVSMYIYDKGYEVDDVVHAQEGFYVVTK